MSSYSNFINGALVFRVWRFDGGTELLAKFAYFDAAQLFASTMLDRDKERGANTDNSYFYLAVCENECAAKAYGARAEGRAS